MSKARDLADFVEAGGQLADGAISVSEISDLTATAAELNYMDGVTSAVQTQLDAKPDDIFTDSTVFAQAQAVSLYN